VISRCTKLGSRLVQQGKIISPVEVTPAPYLINDSCCRTDQYLHIIDGQLDAARDCTVSLWANAIRRLFFFIVAPMHFPMMTVLTAITSKNSHRP